MNEFWKRIFRKTSPSCQWKSRLLNQERYMYTARVSKFGFWQRKTLLNLQNLNIYILKFKQDRRRSNEDKMYKVNS